MHLTVTTAQGKQIFQGEPPFEWDYDQDGFQNLNRITEWFELAPGMERFLNADGCLPDGTKVRVVRKVSDATYEVHGDGYALQDPEE